MRARVGVGRSRSGDTPRFRAASSQASRSRAHAPSCGARRSIVLANDHVHCTLARNALGHFVTERAHVESVPEILPCAEKHGAYREMQLVDEARLEKLADRG